MSKELKWTVIVIVLLEIFASLIYLQHYSAPRKAFIGEEQIVTPGLSDGICLSVESDCTVSAISGKPFVLRNKVEGLELKSTDVTVEKSEMPVPLRKIAESSHYLIKRVSLKRGYWELDSNDYFVCFLFEAPFVNVIAFLNRWDNVFDKTMIFLISTLVIGGTFWCLGYFWKKAPAEPTMPIKKQPKKAKTI